MKDLIVDGVWQTRVKIERNMCVLQRSFTGSTAAVRETSRSSSGCYESS